MSRVFFLNVLIAALACTQAVADSVEGRVLNLDSATRMMDLELTMSKDKTLKVGETVRFKVGPGDAAIGYVGRLIQAEAAEYGKRWNLERIFPLEERGEGGQGCQ